MTLEYALLGFLREEPLHGYEIHRRLSEPAGLGLVWRLKQSQLYALLARLEDEAYVTASLEPQHSRPARKIFELTELGRDTFLKWVESPVTRGRDIRLHFLVKLYFAGREGPEVAARLIEQQRLACRRWLVDHRVGSESAQRAHPYAWLVHRFRTGQLEAMLDWLDECQQLVAGDSSST
jgi:DNA-binding PadR family transcriptional regulator